MSVVATLGQVLPRLIFEAVRDPDHDGRLLLHVREGRKFVTEPRVYHDGNTYVPTPLPDGLARSVRFPTRSARFGCTANLIASLRDFLDSHARLQPETIDLLLAFALSSWFCDAGPVASMLYFFGPEAAVSRCLRLLGCLCRRPILLGDADFGGLATLPAGLCATLLFNQTDLDRRLVRSLLASNRRHFRLARGTRRVDLYGAKAFACDDCAHDARGISVTLSPMSAPVSLFTDAQERATAEIFQAKLLRYRLLNYENVRDARIDLSAFGPELQEQAHAWLAPIRDCPELTESVSREIRRHELEIMGPRFSDPRCVVAEAALSSCHAAGVDQIFVSELTQLANALLAGRHEDPALSAKRVGTILRQLGIPTQRVARGFKVDLGQRVRERIHQVAVAYGVPSIDGIRRCEICPEEVIAPVPTP